MSEDQDRLQSILSEALAKASVAERRQYLDEACGQNAELRNTLDSLLAAHDGAGEFLLRPALDSGTRASIVEAPGTVVGRYKLLQQIGEGGFGLVFMAEQQEPVRRRVALKVIKAGMDTKEVIARFEAERQALALMDHPNIAQVLDGGTTASGHPYFVMDLVKGIPITDFCDQNQLSTQARLRLFLHVCAGVQHAHQKGIIHRDLKPSNVLVTVVDGQVIPKIIDFGVAKAIGQKLTEHTLFTRFEQIIGTPAYMSPEQAEWGRVDIDTRSDIYSLGVLLYELLTGTTPFEKETLARAALDEVRRMIREAEPPTPSLRLRGLGQKLALVAKERQTEPSLLAKLVRGDLDWITMRALEKDRGRRYDTVNGLAHDVQRHLSGEPVSACPPSTAYRAAKFMRKHRAPLAGAAIVVLGLATGLVLALFGLQQARVERQRAQAEARTAQTVNGYLQSQLLASSLQQNSNSLVLAPYQMAVASLATGATNDYKWFARQVLTPALHTSNPDNQRMAAEVCFLMPEVPTDLKRAFDLTNLVANRFDVLGQAARGMAEYRRGNLAEALTCFEIPRRCGLSFLASQANYFCGMIYFRLGQQVACKQAMQRGAERLAGCLRASAITGNWHEYARAAIIRREAEMLILGREVSTWENETERAAAREGWARVHDDLAAADAFAQSNQWVEAHNVLLKALHDPGFDWETASGPVGRGFAMKLGISLLKTHETHQYQEWAAQWLVRQGRFPFPASGSMLRQLDACLLAPLPKPAPALEEAGSWISALPDEDNPYKDLVREKLAYRTGNFKEAIEAGKELLRTPYYAYLTVAEAFLAMSRMRLNQTFAAGRGLESAEGHEWTFVGRPDADPWSKAMAEIALEEAQGVVRESKERVQFARTIYLSRALSQEACSLDWPRCVTLVRQMLKSTRPDQEVMDISYRGAVAALLASDTNSYREFSSPMLNIAMTSTNRDWARAMVEIAALAPEQQTNLAAVYSLSNRIVGGEWDLTGKLARGILEYRQGRLDEAFHWLDGARHSISLGFSAQAECFRAMILQQRGNLVAATNSLHRADEKLALLVKTDGLCIGSDWLDYGLAAISRAEAERSLFGREVSLPLAYLDQADADRKMKPISDLLSSATLSAERSNWAQARNDYVEALRQPGFAWEGFAWVPEQIAVACLLAGDVATHQRISQEWLDWLNESPEPAYAPTLIKCWLARPMPADDPLVRAAVSWRERMCVPPDDSNLVELVSLVRIMIDYRSAHLQEVMASAEQVAKMKNAWRVAAARTFLAMALARLGQVEEGRRELREAEKELASDLTGTPGDDWWDRALCQLLFNEAHLLFQPPPPVAKTQNSSGPG